MGTRLLNRLGKLQARRSDPLKGIVMLKEASLRNAVTERPSDAINYISECMEPIPFEYTQKTYEESLRVQEQLKKAFTDSTSPIEFEHQGSVSNNTHIRYHSDLDLLVVNRKCVTVVPPLVADPAYEGDPLEDLREIRSKCAETLIAKFPKAQVDTSGARSISISGGSLARKVDVVPCNWLHTEEYSKGAKHHRGIKILNVKEGCRETNFPFLHNYRIEQKDLMTGGNLRRIIRLMKSIRSDSDEKIGVSSYDLVGLCYAMPLKTLSESNSGVELLGQFIVFSYEVMRDSSLQAAFKVPNETRPLFCDKGLSVSELDKLCDEGMELLGLSAKQG